MSIIRSLLITMCVSGMLASVCWSSGFDFWKSFMIVTIIQVFLSWCVKTTLTYMHNYRDKQMNLEFIREYSKQSVVVGCSYCSVENTAPVRFDRDNDFVCINCGKENALYVNITATQKTTPYTNGKFLVNTMNDDEQRAIDSFLASDE